MKQQIKFNQTEVGKLPVNLRNLNQKIDAPPRLKRRGLIGARFLDARKFLKNGIFCTEICQREQISCARSVPHTKVCGFQTLRHDGFKFYLIVSVFLLLLLSFSIVSADMNSTNYKTKSSVTSNTGGNSSSSNFISRFIMGIISGNIISETYKNFVGFFQGGSFGCEIFENVTLE